MKSRIILSLIGILNLVTVGCDSDQLEQIAAAASNSRSGSAYGGSDYRSNDGNDRGYGESYRRDNDYRRDDAYRQDVRVPYGVRMDARQLDTATDRLRLEVEHFMHSLGKKPTGGFLALKNATNELETASDRFSDLFKGNDNPSPSTARERLDVVELASERVADRIDSLRSTPSEVIRQSRVVSQIVRRLDGAIR